MNKERFKPVTKIKTADELLDDYVGQDPFSEENVRYVINKARKELLDYIADNIETDYTYHGHKAGEIDLANNLEVYVLKGQFDKIKKLIK